MSEETINESARAAQPRRFRIKLPSDTKRPFDHALRYGCYFPATDLCVSDMGGRGTGEPKDVEWID